MNNFSTEKSYSYLLAFEKDINNFQHPKHLLSAGEGYIRDMTYTQGVMKPIAVAAWRPSNVREGGRRYTEYSRQSPPHHEKLLNQPTGIVPSGTREYEDTYFYSRVLHSKILFPWCTRESVSLSRIGAKWGVRGIHKSSQMCIQANTDNPSAL